MKQVVQNFLESRESLIQQGLKKHSGLFISRKYTGLIDRLIRSLVPLAGVWEEAVEIREDRSAISTYPGVRRIMVAHQRSFAESAGAVVEGRDIGTKVFPDTPHKFFLQAPLATRVRRRLKQLEESGQSNLSADELMREVSERDERDSTRAESPLTVNSSYRIVDTGSRSIEEVVQVILEEIR